MFRGRGVSSSTGAQMPVRLELSGLTWSSPQLVASVTERLSRLVRDRRAVYQLAVTTSPPAAGLLGATTIACTPAAAADDDTVVHGLVGIKQLKRVWDLLLPDLGLGLGGWLG